MEVAEAELPHYLFFLNLEIAHYTLNANEGNFVSFLWYVLFIFEDHFY